MAHSFAVDTGKNLINFHFNFVNNAHILSIAASPGFIESLLSPDFLPAGALVTGTAGSSGVAPLHELLIHWNTGHSFIAVVVNGGLHHTRLLVVLGHWWLSLRQQVPITHSVSLVHFWLVVAMASEHS